nr:biotin--[acetyl-CoA-carboxylase] ligase [Marinicella sp. NBU2979]
MPAINCQYVDSIDSTQGAVVADGLLIADHQSAGQGRRGHAWLTPQGRSVCLSHRFTLPLPPAQMAGYQMVAAVAIAESIWSFEATADVALKWPNDLLHNGAKFAGVLITLRPQKNQTEVTLGIGLNWSLTPAQRQQVARPVTNVPLTQHPTRSAFIIRLLQHIQRHNQAFVAHGLSPSLPVWQAHDALRGQTLALVGEGPNHSGRYAGVDPQGQLCLETAEGIKHFSSGEVSVKAL